MQQFDNITTATEKELIVGFVDLTRFARFSQKHSAHEVFDTLSEYYEYVGEIIENAGGKVVKFIGDAVLIVFPPELVIPGVLALKKLQDDGDRWLREHDMSCRHIITAHFGPVCCGPIGTKSDKRFDVFGTIVNTAAMLESHGFAMTPQVFRKLDPDTRKLFKKHTPPITYIPIEESHKSYTS